MSSFNFDTWIRQPSTLHGLAAGLGGLAATVSHQSFGNPTLDALAAAISYVLMHVLVDDHSVPPDAVPAAAARPDQGDIAEAGQQVVIAQRRGNRRLR
jgi:hypothetical protein